MKERTLTFAWCFSHGLMHTFDGEPWCTASWVVLDASDKATAHAVKLARFGDAQFMRDLPFEIQIEVADEVMARD